MDRQHFYTLMRGEGRFDYELYLSTPQLLACQKNYADFCNRDELMFQVVYQSGYQHDDAYMVAEALAEYDELFQKFRYHHIQLIHRSIGLHAHSLKGRSVDLLEEGMKTKFFPELWEIRHQMTDLWGASYG